MPIRINLMAEAQAMEELRRRDPIKRAIFAGALILALVLAWCSYLFMQVTSAKSALEQVQGSIAARKSEYDRVTAISRQFAETQKKLTALDKLNSQRLFQGDLLNALQLVSVDHVRLTRFRETQNFSSTSWSSVTNDDGTITDRPAVTTEKVLLIIEAQDSGANPGDQVNNFKDAIISQTYFQSALEKTNGVLLKFLSSPQLGPDGRPYVSFTLECRFKDKKR